MVSFSNLLKFNSLSRFSASPRGEDNAERLGRENSVHQTGRRGGSIDENTKAARLASKEENGGQPVRVLILGAPGSGKSTLVKNLQLAMDRATWLQGRSSWRPVIYLDLVTSVNAIVSILREEFGAHSRQPISSEHRNLVEKLAQLEPLQAVLTNLLSNSRQNDEDFLISSSLNWGAILETSFDSDPLQHLPQSQSKNTIPSAQTEIVVSAANLLNKLASDINLLWKDETVKGVLKNRDFKLEFESELFLEDLDRITKLDYEPSDDDIARARASTIGVQEYRFSPSKDSISGQSFAFNRDWVVYDIGGGRWTKPVWESYFDGITSVIFIASISDFDEPSRECISCDCLPDINHAQATVCRSTHWTPPRPSSACSHSNSKLEDSLHMWKQVCESKALSKVGLVLFLNKCDLLQRKLRVYATERDEGEDGAGIGGDTRLDEGETLGSASAEEERMHRLLYHSCTMLGGEDRAARKFREFVPSFEEKSGDFRTVVHHFKKLFRDIQLRCSIEPREFFVHTTCLIDTKSTAVDSSEAQESIWRMHVRETELV